MTDVEFLIRHALKLAAKYPGEPEKVVNDTLHLDVAQRLAALPASAREAEGLRAIGVVVEVNERPSRYTNGCTALIDYERAIGIGPGKFVTIATTKGTPHV